MWQLGHYEVGMTPQTRGFDKFYGHYTGAIFRFSHYAWHACDSTYHDSPTCYFDIHSENQLVVRAWAISMLHASPLVPALGGLRQSNEQRWLTWGFVSRAGRERDLRDRPADQARQGGDHHQHHS